MKEDWIYKRGDLYYANLNPYFGSEQGGTRPVLVLQNNVGNLLFCWSKLKRLIKGVFYRTLGAYLAKK